MKPFHLSIPSRRLPAACLIAFLIAPMQPFGAETNGLAAALQKGLFEEEANRNLGEAIKAYQAATALFDQDRKLAATAIFRLAECYRKQGNTNDALAQYQRVVGEFGDQSEVNTPARQALLALGGASMPGPAAAGPGATPEADEIARIAEMIRNSPDLINAKGQGGMRPLYQAACKGQVGVAQYLLDHGAEVNSGSADSGALQCAALNGHRAMVELLLSRKADVNATDNLGATALHLAARQGFRTVVETLLAHGAEVDARDNSGETPLHYAAAGGNKGVIELLLDHKAEVNAKSEGGATPLLLAISKKEVESAKALLAHKADPNVPGNVTLDGTLLRGYYPIHVAVKARNDELLDLLLKNGAKPNVMTTAESERPLNLAVSLKRKSAAELLLKAGADPNLSSGNQRFVPLVVAIGNRAPDMVDLLLAHHADPNAKNPDGNGPLYYAINSGQKDIVESLLDHKADIELENGERRTPLSLAASQGRQELVELLLARGANPNASDSGQTPLMEVLRNTSKAAPQTRGTLEAIAAALRQRGALEDVPQLDRIEIRRSSAKYSQTIFRKGTNDWNQFTLFDLIAVHYGFASASSASTVTSPLWLQLQKPSHTLPGSLAFPDLANVTILRVGPDGRSRAAKNANLISRLNGKPCQDVPLEWGDVIEIPELDHPLYVAWTGFSAEQLAVLTDCEKRSIQITVKGQTKIIVLGGMPASPDASNGIHALNEESLVPQFSLVPVLYQSGLIRASSDLTRVKVRRADARGGGREWTIDCTKAGASDLWLRDGDQIEVPEKPGEAAGK